MGIFTHSKLERDFAGGIYVPKLGKAPSMEILCQAALVDVLKIPITLSDNTRLRVNYRPDDKVMVDAVIAESECGRRLFAPANGVIGQIVSVGSDDSAEQLAVEFIPDEKLGCRAIPGKAFTPDMADKGKVINSIRRGGIIVPSTGELLADMLQRFRGMTIDAVVANATALEPNLTGGIAILKQFPSQVFAGLAILRNLLDVDKAIMAYPYRHAIDKEAADMWQVECVGVTEKYPQARDAAVLSTLQKRKYLTGSNHRQANAVVFDIFMLKQVERLVLADVLPVSRIVTISGDGINNPGHFMVPVGMPLKQLLVLAGIYSDSQCVIDGSSLSGRAINPEKVVIDQVSQNYMVIRRLHRDLPGRCIRCGRCIHFCPIQLDPVRLMQLIERGEIEKARNYGVDDCIRCGICSYFCPSRLSIMEHISLASDELADGSSIGGKC